MTAAVRERPRTDARANSIASHRAAPTRNNRSKTTGRRTKPQLKVLNQQAIRQRARRRNALLSLFVLVLLGFFAVAFIQAQLVADQQDLDVLRARIAKAETDNARMTRDVEIASSPAVIVTRAKELGMVRAYQPVYIEAVAPVRDIPNAPVFDPETPQGFELAAPQAVSVDGVSPGISSGGSIESADSEVVIEALAAPETSVGVSVETGQIAAVDQQTTAPVTTPAETASSLSGVTVASSQTGVSGQSVTQDNPVAPVVVPESAPVAAAGVSQPAGSIAGSRAVAGGSGNG